MPGIQTIQMRAIYALGRDVGLSDPDAGREDPLHDLVLQISGKQSIKELTEAEADAVISRLMGKMTGSGRRAAELIKNGKPASKAQMKLVWSLMYQLAALDTEPTNKKVGERLCGVIFKTTGKEADTYNLFKGITDQEASAVIEEIKRYIASARRRKSRAEVVTDGSFE